MGMPGIQELLIIAAIAFLLFGSRLPKVMGSLGQGITEFKRGISGLLPDDSAPTRNDDPSFGNDPNYEKPRTENADERHHRYEPPRKETGVKS